jgi:hypothetical protein
MTKGSFHSVNMISSSAPVTMGAALSAVSPANSRVLDPTKGAADGFDTKACADTASRKRQLILREFILDVVYGLYGVLLLYVVSDSCK